MAARRLDEHLQRSPGADWPAWAELVCEPAEVEDVAMLGRAAAADHSDLRGEQLVCNPVFEQSIALGGADADVITHDGVLLDFKSTSTSSVIGRRDLWQLCGYALADTHNEFEITGVGLSALRWRSRVAWDIEQVLRELGGTGATKLAELRKRFAELLPS